MKKWQEQYMAHVGALTLEELIELVVMDAGGDDYDGEFTERGEWAFEAIKKLLSDRLLAERVIKMPLFIEGEGIQKIVGPGNINKWPNPYWE